MYDGCRCQGQCKSWTPPVQIGSPGAHRSMILPAKVGVGPGGAAPARWVALPMGVAAGKGASAGAMREPTASNAAPTTPATPFTALDLPPGRHLRPIGAIS